MTAAILLQQIVGRETSIQKMACLGMVPLLQNYPEIVDHMMNACVMYWLQTLHLGDVV